MSARKDSSLTFEQALKVFGIPNLIGYDEESLKKVYRKLVKERHPDAMKETEYDIIVTKEAYEFLLAQLKTSVLEVRPGLKVKSTKVMLLKAYQTRYCEERLLMLHDFAESDIFIDGFLSIVITRDKVDSAIKKEKGFLYNETRRIKFMANQSNVYSIKVFAPMQIGDTIKLSLFDGFEVSLQLNAPFANVQYIQTITPTNLKDNGSLYFKSLATKFTYNIMVYKSEEREVGVVIC